MGFHIPGVASGSSRCGGGSRGDDGCTPSLGLSVDTEFSKAVQDSEFSLDWVAHKPRGSLPGPSRPGLTSRMGTASDRMAGPACQLRWPALIRRLPMGVRGSHGRGSAHPDWNLETGNVKWVT